MTKFLNISTDTTLGGNSPSDETVSSQKAVKDYVDTHSSGSPAWGSITGTLSNQTDLQNALNAKQDVATAINYDNISNCITEIPQDIKLELNNGTLTLKAGSKLYYPNGLDSNNKPKFTTRITTEDYVANGQYGYDPIPHILSLNSASYWVTPYIGIVFSGTTTPTNFGQFALWYDTANNVIKWTGDSGSTWSVQDCSLPFGIATYNGGSYENGFKQIDQIFNGFGYIGSTVFALPGVKGLIPDGRNADGSLKSTEFTTSNVSIWTSQPAYSWDAYIATQTGNSIYALGTNDYHYNETENYNYFNGSNNNSTWLCKITQSSGRITSLTPKTAFHAVDYNDFSDLAVNVLKALYPVGSVYITTANSCPLSTLISGSTWVLVSSGRVLQGADSGHNAGSTIEAGLPNIIGSGVQGYEDTFSGAITGTYINDYGGYMGGTPRYRLNLDASRSNSIYGNSSTVQPPAYVVNIWQRTA